MSNSLKCLQEFPVQRNISHLHLHREKKSGTHLVVYVPRDCNPYTTSSVTIVHWISESIRPFCIVKDQGLHWLYKTGQLHFYLPDDTTVAKDVKFLHDWSEHHLTEELQVNPLNPHLDLTTLNLQQAYPGNLAYQLDC